MAGASRSGVQPHLFDPNSDLNEGEAAVEVVTFQVNQDVSEW